MTTSDQSAKLPRADCPVCRGVVALRRGGLLREHRDHRHELYGVPGAVRDGKVPICPGSGLDVGPGPASNRPRAGAELLEHWERLTASMDALRVTKSLSEAVHALEAVRDIVGTGAARDIADDAIVRIEAMVTAEVDLDA